MRFPAPKCVAVLGLIIAALPWPVLADDLSTGRDAQPRRLLLLGQARDYEPGEHEYLAGQRLLKKLLDRVGGIESVVVAADEPWADGPQIDKADGVVIFVATGAKWIQKDAARLSALKRLAVRGGGISALHWGMGTRDAEDVAEFVNLLGACHGGPDRKHAVVELRTEVPETKHPILTKVEPVAIKDEFYYRLKLAPEPARIIPLLRAPIEGESHMVAWGWERPDGGRSFGFSGVHYHKNWQHDAYRRLVAQGVAWTMKRPIPTAGLNVEITPADLELSSP